MLHSWQVMEPSWTGAQMTLKTTSIPVYMWHMRVCVFVHVSQYTRAGKLAGRNPFLGPTANRWTLGRLRVLLQVQHLFLA